MSERADTESAPQRTTNELPESAGEETHDKHYSDASDTDSINRYCPYAHYRPRVGSGSDYDNDDSDDEDPYQELFMNAYRSAPASSEDEDEEPALEFSHPDAKPLSLMDDADLWDHMDENELKERLKDHPRLLEEITRKRKRRMLEQEGEANDDLGDVLDRFTKHIRMDPTRLS
ncbi:uncharacterized protein LOC126571830 [Anopheles aquasalis]|uniref:uncharacterized protein LOC126571830 n=1 Tax=Anopheles aquasalis TaxID=42839 RepID=UPI00215A6CBE|nr:uncharacterized protein LOC126571830 [Anopheles aquasalis]